MIDIWLPWRMEVEFELAVDDRIDMVWAPKNVYGTSLIGRALNRYRKIENTEESMI